MKIKLFDSELKILEILWDAGDLMAKDIAAAAKEQTGWSKTTTYTVIKKCIDKGAVTRSDPGFVCHAQISREEVQQYETEELIDKMYDGSADKLVAALLDRERLNRAEIDHLKALINEL